VGKITLTDDNGVRSQSLVVPACKELYEDIITVRRCVMRLRLIVIGGIAALMGTMFYAEAWSEVGVTASDTVQVSMPDTTAMPGDTLDIPVLVSDVTGLGVIGVGLKISYDVGKLTAISARTVGTIAEGWGPPTFNVLPGQVKIGMAGYTPVSGGGVLVYIKFAVSSLVLPGSSSLLHFVEANFNEGMVPTSTHDGSVSSFPGPSPVHVSIPNTRLGDTLFVPINLDDDVTGMNFVSAGIKLTYNGSVLTAVGVDTSGTLVGAAQWGLVMYNIIPGQINIGMAGTSALAGSGPLVYVGFCAAPTAQAGDSTVVHFMEMKFNDIGAVTEDGIFCITSGPPQAISGMVIDQATLSPIGGAVVQAWDSYPDGSVLRADTTGADGRFSLPLAAWAYDIRTYAYTLGESGDLTSGYYAKVLENISSPCSVDIALEPVPQVVGTRYVCDYWGTNATLRWGSNRYPVQIGDIIMAEDPDGVICGVTVVWSGPGQYAIHVTGDDETSPEDEGAEEGDIITFRLNGVWPNAVQAPLWTNQGSFQHEAEFVREVNQMIPLDEGWNLFSFYVDPPNDSLRAALDPSLDDKYDWVGGFVHGQWDTWARGRPDFANDLKRLRYPQGYWIKMSVSDTLEVVGMPVPADTPIPLDAGWNLISYLPYEPDSLRHALSSLDDLCSWVGGFVHGQWDTWARGRPDFANDLKVMSPGQGYWINMDQADTLRYPTSGYVAGEGLPKAVVLRETSRLKPSRWVCDFWGGSENVTLGGRPARVGDVITVRDPDGVICGEVVVTDPRGFVVHVYGDDRETGFDEGAEDGDRLEFYINGRRAEIVLGEGIWREFGSEEIGLRASVQVREVSNIPGQYVLFQNCPNPFNAWTVIRYGIPFRSYVEVVVYDIGGQEVRRLVEGWKEGGYHVVVWDGRDDRGVEVASGIYFCRFKVGKFQKIRKMVMVK